MTTPSITLEQSQTFAPAASQEATQKGSLEGRSVVPCPSKRWLTDTQIKRIALVALVIFAVAVPMALASAFTFGIGGVLLTAMAGMAGAAVGLSSAYFLWPKADFQTPKGAEIIRNDLKKMKLTQLYDDYSFSDLAKYGYISKENSEKMQGLYKSRPVYMHTYDARGEVDIWASVTLNRAFGVFDKERRIEDRYRQLRNHPGFLL